MSADDDELVYGAEGEGEADADSPEAIAAQSGDWDDLDHALCALPMNDLANAKRLLARNVGRMFWTREWGPAMFDGQRFNFEHGGAMVGQAAQAAAEAMLARETAAFWATQRRKGVTLQAFKKLFGRFWLFALSTGNNGRTEAMLKQAERRTTRPLADFDRDPDRLVVGNGTLTLPRDGSPPVLAPGFDPAHLITRRALAAYDPHAKAPTFAAFLDKVQPNPENRAYLARVFGYCLTGHVGEQAYFIFHGKGGDGKSTLLNAIGDALGDYVVNAAIDTFLKHERKGSDHSADLARLASGVRLVKAAEPEQGARLAEAVIKTVTGGEPFPARAMYREPFEFLPAWKLIISCNRKPRITGGDRGIWRRTNVVPWPVSIPEAEMDRGLDAKLRAEAGGILNWMLAGWADWLERGLDPPADVKAATEEYRLNSDPFAAWSANCLIIDPEARAPAATLFKSYRGWAVQGGFDVMKQTSFGRALSEMGLTRKHSNGIVWLGVKLNAAGEEALEAADRADMDARYGGE